MDTERISDAIEVLQWINDQLQAGNSGNHRATMMGHLAIANSYLTEYRAHLHQGKSPQDALAATARGELKIG